MSAYKLLYINHPEGDYGGSFLFLGLCHELGSENVITYPRKDSYYGQEHHYSVKDIPNGLTGPFPWVPAFPDPYPEEYRDRPQEYVGKLLTSGEFDAVVLESAREYSIKGYDEFLPIIRSRNLPVAVVDGEDFWQFRDEILAYQFPIYLKREVNKERYPINFKLGNTYVESFPFSCPLEEVASLAGVQGPDRGNLVRDIFFSAGATSKDREVAVRALRGDREGYTAHVALAPDYERQAPGGSAPTNPNLLPWNLHLQEMSRSKMALSVRGFGEDTCRYWDAAATSVLVTHDLKIHIPNPFTDGVNYLRLDILEQLPQFVRKWKDNPVLDDIAKAGREHVEKFHSTRARAKRLLELLGNA